MTCELLLVSVQDSLGGSGSNTDPFCIALTRTKTGRSVDDLMERLNLMKY